MISHRHKCIFVHIPKTGGCSVERLLWPSSRDRTEENLWMGFIDRYRNKYQTGGLQHLLASQIRREIGDQLFAKYFKFAIVRNPWDKAVSQYANTKRRPDLLDFLGMRRGDSFKRYLSLIQKREHVQWTPQYRFVLDAKGKPLVDHIGRFEKFDAEVKNILRQLGVRKWRIPHANKGKKKIQSYRDVYDAEAREMVQQIYKEDIQLLRYRF